MIISPLFKKLNLTSQSVIHVLNAPPAFAAELRKLDLTVKRTVKGESSFALAFVITQQELEAASRALAKACLGDAILWMAYPKGTSKQYRCEFNRDNGWPILGAAGFEPVRMVAIDADWSALRFRRAQFIKTMTRAVHTRISKGGRERGPP